jgi:hypothetical protein
MKFRLRSPGHHSHMDFGWWRWFDGTTLDEPWEVSPGVLTREIGFSLREIAPELKSIAVLATILNCKGERMVWAIAGPVLSSLIKREGGLPIRNERTRRRSMFSPHASLGHSRARALEPKVNRRGVIPYAAPVPAISQDGPHPPAPPCSAPVPCGTGRLPLPAAAVRIPLSIRDSDNRKCQLKADLQSVRPSRRTRTRGPGNPRERIANPSG